MFERSDRPRLFGVAIGQDFSRSLYDGLVSRFENMTPTQIAQVEIYVNTRRMQRRLTALFHDGAASLLPRIRLVTDLGQSIGMSDIPPAMSSLKRKLEVAQLVKQLIIKEPTLASQDSAFDLADSLVTLMGEMQGEGVGPDVISGLDISDQSGHWQRALKFINIVQDFFSDDVQPDLEGRQRRVVMAQIARWSEAPPTHPILVAGSTGSRGATSLFMEAVAKLPQGALVLPGVDYDLPRHIWERLEQEKGGEDHPQYRFKSLCDTLETSPDDIGRWVDAPASAPSRTALVSLSLRPAPVTNQWIEDGAKLTDIAEATREMTLIEASTPRAEADAIAVRLRQSVHDGQVAALITPDRMLTRQVTAALDRWNITPDDSAGLPLQLSAPGRLLRHVTDAFCGPLTAEQLLVLLRHPLTNSDGGDRGPHGLRSNALELQFRRYGPPFPTIESLKEWASKTSENHPDRAAWVDWIADTLFTEGPNQTRPLCEHVRAHLRVTEQLAGGPSGTDGGGLWKEAAGREAFRIMSELRDHAEAGGEMTAREYRQLVGALLAGGEVRNRDEGDPRVLIWGTLEARVQSADLVILGGMNEGVWPEAPAPDPWLNRPMRLQAGLLLPERRIGLSAHDYQQAVCSREVVISRAIRSDEAETVPSRWVNRLMNLLGGLTAQDGPAHLDAMRARGQQWLDLAATIAAPTETVDPARRPSPCPPIEARPKQLSVTQIQTLIRDPYAIYARKVLGLNQLDPLTQAADAPLRGIIVHEILERFVRQDIDPSLKSAADELMAIAEDVLLDKCPWPAMRSLWRARIAAFVPHFLEQEQERRAMSDSRKVELMGALKLAVVDFTLTCKADRIDLTDDNEALIYDYKTGDVPTQQEQMKFDTQLLLEAVMVEQGAFKGIGALRTKDAIYVGLGSKLKNQNAPLDEAPPDETLTKFAGLMAKWMVPFKGYTSRRAVKSMRFDGNYDHLARYGEWDETSDPVKEDLS